jgi:CysZ protein
MTPLPNLNPRGPLIDLFSGAALPFRAARVILGSPRLRALSLLAGTVTAATLVGLVFLSLEAAQRIGGWLVPETTRAGGAAYAVGTWLLEAALALVLFALGALTAPNLMLAPLQDPLSEATEAAFGGFVAPPWSLRSMLKGTVESLVHTLGRLVFVAGGLVVLFPLNFVPVAGSVLWVVGSSTWSAFWLAVEHLSTPAARHLQPFRQVVRVLRGRLALALGFGGTLTVLLWVPVLNFFLLPLAVVAGTLLFCGLPGEPRGTSGRRGTVEGSSRGD